MTRGYWVFLASILCGLMAIASTQSEFRVVDGLTSETVPGFTVTYKYDRVEEVKKHCESVLSSAAEFRLDRNKISDIKEELFFMNGDWGQVVGKNPLLPFDNTGVGNLPSPSKLVSFWVSDVKSDHQSKKYATINGLLVLGMTVDGMFVEKSFDTSPHFQIWPGHSELSIFFQGVYTESESKGGERVMCLLGNTLLPSREPDSTDQWVKNSGSEHNQASLSEDDQILLILRYPMKFTLTNREIKGKMTSLNPKSNLKYFDEVTISSQLTRTDNYEFSSEKIVSKACGSYPYQDKLFGNISTYQGLAFCQILEEITREQAFSVLPNWRCNMADNICRKMGPFGSNKEINETDGGFKDVKLSMQNIKCEQSTIPGSVNSAKVSAVFRAISPKENLYTAEKRSGLSNMSLAAEGIWKSSSGQLCMVGCLGIVDAEGSGCNARICMYIPTYFSIKQRSIILGTISAMDEDQSYIPLSFEKLVQPSQIWNYFQDSHPHYEYTKFTAAGVVLEKNQAFKFGDVIKKSLLQFPKLEDSEAYEVSLALLSEDLSLHVSADQQADTNTIRTDVSLEIVSVGPLFGRYWSNASIMKEETPYHGKAEYTEKQLLLNVSAQLSLLGGDSNNFSALFLEGLYDPHVGKMFLVCCRDIRASWNILSESGDLEDGLDCLIDAAVSYPPTTARWLVNPTASISISSQRTKDDPLYFQAIKLETFPIMYRKQREDILSRRGVEGILRMLTLSVAIACITSQIFYVRHNVDSVPYISLVMLGVQVLGYSLPLVTGAEAFFKTIASNSYEMQQSYDLDRTLWYRLIEYAVKLLLMISLLLTLRLCQKVWRSRIRLLARAPLEPCRVPSDKRVLIATFLTHLIGYILVLFVHSSLSSKRLFRIKSYLISGRKYRMMQGWETELEEYVGLVQDFFLFPQVIGNLLWQIDGKPLRKLYFVGITLVRLLPHFYDYLRAPSLNPYFAEEYEFVNPKLDYYSKFGDIAIPLTAFFLAVIVYIQQRWKYEKLSRSLTLGRFKLLPMASRMYERLPSVAVEAELSSGASGKSTTHNGNHSDLE